MPFLSRINCVASQNLLHMGHKPGNLLKHFISLRKAAIVSCIVITATPRCDTPLIETDLRCACKNTMQICNVVDKLLGHDSTLHFVERNECQQYPVDGSHKGEDEGLIITPIERSIPPTASVGCHENIYGTSRNLFDFLMADVSQLLKQRAIKNIPGYIPDNGVQLTN